MSTILIGVDSTARSEDAVAFANRLAHASAAEVFVASAFIYADVPGRGGNLDYRGILRADALETVERMKGLLDVPAERVRGGVYASTSPAHVLHDVAEAEHAALVVVGSSHTGHLGRVLPGSTGERMLHGAPCAVAVVPHGYRTRPDQTLRRVGVAYDGSAEARDALAVAVAVSRALGGTLQVIRVLGPEAFAAPALMVGAGYSALLADVEAEARAELQATVAALGPDISPAAVVLDGQPWRELSDHSATLDLLLVGSRGYGPLRALVVGGTSGPVLRHAHCPVIALPRGSETPLGELFPVVAGASA